MAGSVTVARWALNPGLVEVRSLPGQNHGSYRLAVKAPDCESGYEGSIPSSYPILYRK